MSTVLLKVSPRSKGAIVAYLGVRPWVSVNLLKTIIATEAMNINKVEFHFSKKALKLYAKVIQVLSNINFVHSRLP